METTINYDNKEVTLLNGVTMSVNEFSKRNAEYLIGKLESKQGAFSKELKHILNETLGKDVSCFLRAYDDMENEPEALLCSLYDININIALHELIYPDWD